MLSALLCSVRITFKVNHSIISVSATGSCLSKTQCSVCLCRVYGTCRLSSGLGSEVRVISSDRNAYLP